MKHILVTGGAGFVGSNLAINLKKHFGENCRIVCLDNLKRRGSELNISRLNGFGIEFVHGDIRNIEDFEAIDKVDLILECSAEPSVLAGYNSSPAYLVQTNLQGTINCLEIARTWDADFIFLSTSRVYPIKTINCLNLEEQESRFVISDQQSISGISPKGISEAFPLEGVRSLYGATKLCSEYIIQEYIDMYGIRGVINRCGVLTGPWQMGKVDQGVVVLWIARHIYGGSLSYFGYGGTGKQVRDILDVEDLATLVLNQYGNLDKHNNVIYNVGGGNEVSISLKELTELCQQATGNSISISAVQEDRVADIPYYITDNTKITKTSGWTPQKKPVEIVENITRWIRDNLETLKPLLG